MERVKILVFSDVFPILERKGIEKILNLLILYNEHVPLQVYLNLFRLINHFIGLALLKICYE